MPDTKATTEIKFKRTETDFLNYCRLVAAEHSETQVVFNLGAFALAFVVLEFGALPVLRGTETWAAGSAMQTGITVAAFFCLFHAFKCTFGMFTKQAFVDADGDFVSPKTVTISEDGLLETSSHGKTETAWRAVSELRQDGGYIMFYIDKFAAYIIPESAFPDETAATNFYMQALEYWKAAKSHASRPWSQ